jgi:hypothetical protein
MHSHQSVRKFTSIFYETSGKLAAQWMKLLDNSETEEVEIEVTNWAGRFAFDTSSSVSQPTDLLTASTL